MQTRHFYAILGFIFVTLGQAFTFAYDSSQDNLPDVLYLTGNGERASGVVQTYNIPIEDWPDEVRFTAVGGDGGRGKANSDTAADKNGEGGGGASITATFAIDPDDTDALRPGGQIRFIVGNKGEGNSKSGSGYGGGGGGTGILYLAPENGATWEPLVIAGGGGGGAAEQNTGSAYEENGGNANAETYGDNSATDGGTAGNPGVSITNSTGGGGGWNQSASPTAGGGGGGGDEADPMGGAGGISYGSGGNGGFGCGGGGAAHRAGGHYGGGGGGGGYSGGGAGESTNNNDEAGGGAGSYTDERAILVIASTRGSGQNEDGRVWVQTVYTPDSGEKVLDGPTILLDPASDVSIAYADYRDGVASELPAYEGFDLYHNSVDVTPGYNTFMLNGEPGSYLTLYLAYDQFGKLGTASQTITLLPPDRPTFSLAGNVSVSEDSGEYAQEDFADTIDVNYSGVSFVGFTVSNDNNALFATQPGISVDGTLEFMPAANAYGSTTVTVTGHSDIEDTDYADSEPQTFTITVNRNFSDDPPDDLSLSNEAVLEGSVIVGTASAVSYPSDTVTYSLADNNDAELFDIDAETGVLSFRVAPDFENPQGNGHDNIYLVNIFATGEEGQDQLQASITVANVEEPPSGLALSNLTVVENNSLVGSVSATDPTGGSLQFRISGGEDAALFQIVESSDQLSFVAAPDYEQPADLDGDNRYEITIEASGDGVAEASFQITVTNTNESPTNLQLSQETIAENLTDLGTVTATDPEGSTVYFTLAGGEDASLFSIGYSTGALSFRSPPDYEAPSDANADNVYQFNIRATDNSRSAVTAVKVTVTNVIESGISEFRSTYRLADDGSDDFLDWSQNGIANILYFAFGLSDPNNGNIDSSRLPALTCNGDSLTFTYVRRNDQNDITIEAITATDLETWDLIANLPTEELPTDTTTEAEDDTHSRITYTLPIVTDQRFFTVRVNVAAE